MSDKTTTKPKDKKAVQLADVATLYQNIELSFDENGVGKCANENSYADGLPPDLTIDIVNRVAKVEDAYAAGLSKALHTHAKNHFGSSDTELTLSASIGEHRTYNATANTAGQYTGSIDTHGFELLAAIQQVWQDDYAGSKQAEQEG